MAILTHIALNSIFRQDLSKVVEVLIIPDGASEQIVGIVGKYRRMAPVPTRLVRLNMKSRMCVSLAGHPNMNHFVQIINGVVQAAGTHILLHDADLFLKPGTFLRDYYLFARSKDYDVVGVSRRLEEQCTGGADHLVATWEMLAKKEWFMRYPPYYHKGRKVKVGGRDINFDTTLYPQFLTPREKISVSDDVFSHVHFHYVISVYRKYVQGEKIKAKFYMRLLLLRLLVDAWQDQTSDVPVHVPIPLIDDYLRSARGLGSTVPREVFKEVGPYKWFRGNIEKLLSFEVLPDRVAAHIRENLPALDACFGYEGSSDALSRL